jgi:formylglycine-generating enzyme required for sulfatase activity
MGSNPSWFSRHGNGMDAIKGIDTIKDISDEDLNQFPVESVSWDSVQVFIKKLNEREAGIGYTYRLPTEAEWEYACRGGVTSMSDCSYNFYFAKPTNQLSLDQANVGRNYPSTLSTIVKPLRRSTKVGSYPPNKLGLHDMHGNVWQWCQDESHDNAWGWGRVIRGGCWLDQGESSRAASRRMRKPGDGDYTLGFRLARVPSGGK